MKEKSAKKASKPATPAVVPEDNSLEISRKEIDVALNKIFDSATRAVNKAKRSDANVTLEQVDAALQAMFDAINQAAVEGKDIKVPDFSEMLSS